MTTWFPGSQRDRGEIAGLAVKLQIGVERARAKHSGLGAPLTTGIDRSWYRGAAEQIAMALSGVRMPNTDDVVNEVNECMDRWSGEWPS